MFVETYETSSLLMNPFIKNMSVTAVCLVFSVS